LPFAGVWSWSIPGRSQQVIQIIGRYSSLIETVIAWLVAFMAHLGLPLEGADGSVLEAFCDRASLSRTDASMNRFVFTIRNVYAELHSRDWIGLNPASGLQWKFLRQRRCTLDIDLTAVESLLEHIKGRRHEATSSEE
jgi:hypothetical protein